MIDCTTDFNFSSTHQPLMPNIKCCVESAVCSMFVFICIWDCSYWWWVLWLLLSANLPIYPKEIYISVFVYLVNSLFRTKLDDIIWWNVMKVFLSPKSDLREKSFYCLNFANLIDSFKYGKKDKTHCHSAKIQFLLRL